MESGVLESGTEVYKGTRLSCRYTEDLTRIEPRIFESTRSLSWILFSPFFTRAVVLSSQQHPPWEKAFHPHLPVPDAPMSLEPAVWYPWPCRHVDIRNSMVPQLFSIKRKILQKASPDLIYVRSIECLLMVVWRSFQVLHLTIIHETSYACVCIYVSYVGAKFYRPLLKRCPQIQPSRKKQSLKRAQRFGLDSFSLGTVRKAPPWPRRA